MILKKISLQNPLLFLVKHSINNPKRMEQKFIEVLFHSNNPIGNRTEMLNTHLAYLLENTSGWAVEIKS